MSSFPVGVPALELYRGDTFSEWFVFKDAVSGAPRDLDGEGWGEWAAQWRPFVGSEQFVDFTVDVSGLSVGRVGLSLSASQTAVMRRGVWDLQASNGDVVRTWLSGSVSFVEDVTDV